MEYTTKVGDRETQAHVNYQCPCGCTAGLLYDRDQGPEHLGTCCCGRLLWVGPQATAVVRSHYKKGADYEVLSGAVVLPWGEEAQAALAVPLKASVREQQKREAGRTLSKVTDPVCRMMIDPDDAAATSNYQGTTYYFCAVGCKTKFDADPRQYVQSKGFFERLRGAK
jgi:YHS domain-containing protein